MSAQEREALDRAAMEVLQCNVQPVCDGSCNTGVGPCNGEHEERECYEHEDPERVPFTGDVCWFAESVVDALLAAGLKRVDQTELAEPRDRLAEAAVLLVVASAALLDGKDAEKQDYPTCPDHREVQHRDRKPPWCDTCGWNRGRPAIAPEQHGTPRATRAERRD